VAAGQGDSDHGDDEADGGAMDQALRSAARMYADDQATRALGISIDEVAPGRATARMRVTGEMTARAMNLSRRPRSGCGWSATASMTSASAAPMGRCWPNCAVTAGRCSRALAARTRPADTRASRRGALAGCGRVRPRGHISRLLRGLVQMVA
jgi:hypothetical protein